MAESRIVALTGGVGGAKLALGLSRVLGDETLTVVVNTGDDFEHLGLCISPDVDTLMYTLADRNDPERGWGRDRETWSVMEALEEIGAPTWFRLGDRDLALNLYRTGAVREGRTLSEVTSILARRFGLRDSIVPMSDDHVRTTIETDSGSLAFQDYFVRRRCQPEVRRIRYRGAESARPAPAFRALLQDSEVRAYVICPSNPYLSIGPILSLPGVKEALSESAVPVVAVSPIVAGRAVKGPTGKIMGELGIRCDSVEVAAHYRGLIDGIVIDDRDLELSSRIEKLGIRVSTANILMESAQDKCQLAARVLSFAQELARNGK